MVDDVRTLHKINTLVKTDQPKETPSGRLRKKVPYIFVSPEHRETLGHLAIEILHSHRRHSSNLVHRLRQLELDVMGATCSRVMARAAAI
jgi:hypothetical protein